MINRNLILKIVFLSFLAASSANSLQLNNSEIITSNQQEYLSQPISESYLLEIPLTIDNCEKVIGQICFYKDEVTGQGVKTELHFHPTNLVIFLHKIVAVQNNPNSNKSLIRVRDSSYTFKTKNDNIVSFDVLDGDVYNLKLTFGSLSKETKVETFKCNKARFLYDFYALYKKENEISKKTGTYLDEYDFKGVKEYVIFAPKNNITDTMAVISSQTNSSTVDNLMLCQLGNFKELRVRHVTKEQCAQNPTIEECSRYANCRDKIAIKECVVEYFIDGINPADRKNKDEQYRLDYKRDGNMTKNGLEYNLNYKDRR